MKTHCARCGRQLSSDFFEGLGGATRYCSKECYEQVYIPEPEIHYKSDPTPTRLTYSEAELLIGKSSGGRYFERGRCVHCGQVTEREYSEFHFCSDSCRLKAIKPYLPSDFDTPLQDTSEYKRFDETFHELILMGEKEYHEQRVGVETGKSYTEAIDLLRHKRVRLTAAHKQNTVDQQYEALQQYQSRWEAQRTYVLNREKQHEDERLRKEQEKEAEQLVRQQEKDTQQFLKHLEKQAAEDKEKHLFEELIKPRPMRLIPLTQVALHVVS